MGGRSKRSARISSRMSTRGRSNSSADVDEPDEHIIAKEGGNDLNADEATSDSDTYVKQVAERLPHPAAFPVSPSKRKRRASFDLNEGEKLNDPAELAASKRARSTREIRSRDNKADLTESEAADQKHHMSKSGTLLESLSTQMQPSCAPETDVAKEDSDDVEVTQNVLHRESVNHTSDPQVVECSAADEGGSLKSNSPTIENTTVKTIEAKSEVHATQATSDKKINGGQVEPPPDKKTTRDDSSPPLAFNESDCNINTSKTDDHVSKQSNEQTSLGAASDANATNKPSDVTDAGDMRKIRQDVLTTSEPETNYDEFRNDAQSEKLSDKIKDILVASGEDPTVTSSVLGLSGSIKTFAVSDQEANLSVPDSVNASSKLRALSSCSIGESSQKLSWLEDEENDIPVDKAKICAESLGGANCNPRVISAESRAEIETPACVYNKQSEGVEFEFPHLEQSKKHTPSINQLKMALFLESSRVHRGKDGDRAFAKYWESISRFITLSSHATGVGRSSVGIDDTFISFLTTKKLKILHNKLILALMSESIEIEVSARRISQHLPSAWKTKTVELQTPSTITSNRFDDASQQWRKLLGRHSGAWTKYGKDITGRKRHREDTPDVQKFSNIQHSIENELTPSARIPATLQIDPLIRRHTSKLGLRVSENVIWMMVVAVQEYMRMVIQETIATANELSKGYIPEHPKTNMVTIACQPRKSKCTLPVRSEANSGSLEKLMPEKHVIGAAELSLMLSSCPLIAGRVPSSRMALDRSSVLEMREAGHNSFSNVNQVINASIHGRTNQCADGASDIPSIALQPRKKQDDSAPSSQLANAAGYSSTPLSNPTLSTRLAHSDLSLTNGTPLYKPIAKAHFQPVNSDAIATSTQPDKQNTSMNTPDMGLSLATSVLVSKEPDTSENVAKSA